jgi:Domain of unknown function (DUF4272)
VISQAFRRLQYALAVFLMWNAVWSSPNIAQSSNPNARRADIEKRQMAPSQEALDRRARSIAHLKRDGVPTLDSLPVIETASEARPRSADDIVRRAIALVLVANKGELNDQSFVEQLIASFAASDDFSPKEKVFIANPNTTQIERTQFLWRYEALNVLLWAVGFVDTLERPDRIIDVGKVVDHYRDNGRAGLLAKAKLRPLSEILDGADLIYRTHWAVVNARINNQPPPAGLDGGIVMERHYAFNWLIGYMGQEWDDISTDT